MSELRDMQGAYPDPPLVIFLSNNEAPRLRWTGVSDDPNYRSRYGDDHDATFRRSVAAEGWAERYRALESAFRTALVAPRWTSNAIFVGYDAFGPGFVGRWPGWSERSLATEKQMVPEAAGWDGASVPFYVNSGDQSTDYTVYGPQIAAMNWVAMRAELERRTPNFWFEMSTWDGALPGGVEGKPAEYRRRGQVTTPARYGGMVQFGMWLLRPRVVREYRGYLEQRADVGVYFDQVVDAVDRIYSTPTLQTFWRYGVLVANEKHEHPYASALPPWFAGVKRWFMLDTDLDPPRPWNLRTELPVFAIALVMGPVGSRQWLIYAHAPLGDREHVTIDVPEFRPVTVAVKVGGTFAIVDERRDTVQAP
jgi:hypothetical protein